MIVGLSGNAGVGKSEIAKRFVKRGYVEVASADELKRIAMRLFGFTPDQLWGSSKRRKESPPGRPEIPAARAVLQRLGTEGVRASYGPTWIDFALDVARHLEIGLPKASNLRYTYHPSVGLRIVEGWEPPPRGVVISDVRFADEMTRIARHDGMVFRIVRDVPVLPGEYGKHLSEQEMLDIPDSAFNGIIDNRGKSLDELDGTVAKLFEAYEL